MSAILAIFAPILARLVAWVLDWIQTGDETKKNFYKFVAAFEADRGISIRLHMSAQEQFDRIKAEIEANKKQ